MTQNYCNICRTNDCKHLGGCHEYKPHKMGDHSDDFSDTRLCECNKPTANQTLIEQNIYQKGFGDGHKEAREYIKKLVEDEIWKYHKLDKGFLKHHSIEPKSELENSINSLCLHSHNEVLEMIIKKYL